MFSVAQDQADSVETEAALMTLPDVARALGLSLFATRRLHERGKLPTTHVGRFVYIPRPAFEAWVAAKTAEGLAHVTT